MTDTSGTTPRPRLIAVEEAFVTPQFRAAIDALKISPGDRTEKDYLDFLATVPRFRDGLMDFDYRLREMDENGVDLHLLSLTSPGVQMNGPEDGASLAQRLNDELVEIIARYPGRFAGLASVAPQAPEAAAREIERAMTQLKLNGLIINSHSHGKYLDEPEFEPLLAAAEAYGAPIYLHPRIPSPAMYEPMLNYGMLSALWGFAIDAGTHALRLIMSGVFDRHPNLKIVLGHAGEALPYWVYRLDNMAMKLWKAGGPRLGMVELAYLPSEYLKRNFAVTTSGMEDPDVLDFCITKMGIENVMFAIDFPYESSKHATDFIRSAPLSPEQQRKVFSANAERIFRIPSSSTT
jgi:5-carboxyvanillate decarboxylase